jgi:Asp-tRNA(Asn)/Glu-tRNA(Gln) amidotransferase A subunit family amidase
VKQEVPDYKHSLKKDIKGIRIGIPKEYFIEGMDPEVEKAVKDAISSFRKWGAEIQEISLPHTEYAVAIYYIIATAEASSNLARYDGVKYGFRSKGYRDLMEMYTQTRARGFGKEVKRRIILGTYVLSAGYYEAYYRKASQVRTLMRKDFDDAFQKVDVIVSPTAPSPCCTDHMERIGHSGFDANWRFFYKRCRICGYTVRCFYAPSLTAIFEAAREIRVTLAEMNLGTGKKKRRTQAEIEAEVAAAGGRLSPPKHTYASALPLRHRKAVPSAA